MENPVFSSSTLPLIKGGNIDDISNLFKVHGSDFEAVNVSSLMINENSGQARTSSTVTPALTHQPTHPVAAFAANITHGKAPLTVQFTDKSVSTGTTTYHWDVNNDGVVDYTGNNPVHTFQMAGKYTVKLTVTNPSGSDSEIKTSYIRVTSSVNQLKNARDLILT